MLEQLHQIFDSLLSDAHAPQRVRNADVSFETPRQTYAPNTETINLFLYQVHENRDLRDPVPIVEQAGDAYVRRRPPLRVDCSYIVTAWSQQSGATGIAAEHQLLSEALLWLSQFPTIPESFLPPDWLSEDHQAYQPFPLPMWVGQPDGVKEAGEFWAALENPPRSYFNLVITIAMDLRRGIDIGPPVTTKEELLPNPESHLFQIGGRVFNAAEREKGVAEAVVMLAELSKTEITDENGRFSFPSRSEKKSFPGLDADKYTLRVFAKGYQYKEKTINVPGPPDEYEIGLARAGP